jgi:hypothetical protein
MVETKTSEPAQSEAWDENGRKALKRADFYAWVGGAILVAMVGVLIVGLIGVGGVGWFEFGTAMVMIGLSISVLAAGLVVALFATRSTLRQVEAHERALFEQAERYADMLGAAQAERAAEHEKSLDELAEIEERQGKLLDTLGRAEEHAEDEIEVLAARADKVETRVANDERTAAQQYEEFAAEEASLAGRLTREQHTAREHEKALEEREQKLEKRLARDEAAERKAIEAMETEAARLNRTTRRVLEEERERKEEFEALAAEEIRLMGRVRKAEQASRRGWNEAAAAHDGEYYRIARPKNKYKGPFGNVYPVADVEGVGDKRAKALAEIGITNTEDLWRANPAFVAGHLDVDPKVVEQWREMAELMAVHGIGKQYAELLIRSGVDSIETLGKENPEHLLQVVSKSESGRSHRIQGSQVSIKNAEKWIEAAKHHHPRP